MKKIAIFMTALAVLAFSCPAFGQSVPLQAGPWTPGHAPMYSSSGQSQPIIQDSGGAAGGAAGTNPSEIGITARGTGTPPYAAQGGGPNGETFCDYDAPTTNPAGYHYLCLTPNDGTGGAINYGAGGGAAQLPLSINVNGSSAIVPPATANANTVYAGPSSGSAAAPSFRAITPSDLPNIPVTKLNNGTSASSSTFWRGDGTWSVPAGGGNVLGPSTPVAGHIVTFGNTDGTLIQDSGKTPPTFSGALTATGSNQGTAYAITSDLSIFTTVSVGTGAILPAIDPNGNAVAPGYTIEIMNEGVNTLAVYPPSSQQINTAGTNAAVTLYPQGSARFTFASTAQWYTH
jgi:hypothetical protein